MQKASNRSTKKDRKEKLRQQTAQRNRRRAIMHAIKPLLWAFISWFALNTIIQLPPFKGHVYTFFTNFTTHAAYWFSKIIGMPLEMHGVPYLSARGFRMEVVMECTAYTFYLFALTLTIFSRWTLRHKFINLGVLWLGIFIINNFRFATMGYLGSYYPHLFDPVHDIVWDVLFGFLVFGMWAWRETISRRQAAENTTPPKASTHP